MENINNNYANTAKEEHYIDIHPFINLLENNNYIKIYNKNGNYIFEGNIYENIDYLIDLIKNNIEIGGIDDKEGKSIMRFGNSNLHGFIHTDNIIGIFKGFKNNQEHKQRVNKNQEDENINAVRIAYNTLKIKKGNFDFRNDSFIVANGIDVNTGNPFLEVDGEIGINYDSHGIAKVDQLGCLLKILENGIDKNKKLYTAPFSIPKKDRGLLGVALGTSSGTSYKDGIAVLVGDYKKPLEEGIEYIFINDAYYSILEPIKKAFPKYKFYLLSEQAKVLVKKEK